MTRPSPRELLAETAGSPTTSTGRSTTILDLEHADRRRSSTRRAPSRLVATGVLTQVVGRLRLLGQRVAARHAAPMRAGGLRLARVVAAAHRPERIVESATRLARGRSIGAARQVARIEEPLPRPAGMSDFAARWIFGDGPPEGIPIAGEAAMADLVPSETPSFILERDEQQEQSAERERERRSQPVPRGQIEEVRPTGFRLSRKPAVSPAAPAPTPAPAVESDAEPVPLPSPPPPEPPPAASLPEHSLPERSPEPAHGPEPAPAPSAEPEPRPAARLSLPSSPIAAEPPARPEPRVEPPGAPEAAETPPPAAPPAAAVNVPRAKISVARAPVPDEPGRPALRVERREEPRGVPQPAAEPVPAPAAPRRSVLRRAVDAVLRREPAPAQPAARQTGVEDESFEPASTTTRGSAARPVTAPPTPSRSQPAPAPQAAATGRRRRQWQGSSVPQRLHPPRRLRPSSRPRSRHPRRGRRRCRHTGSRHTGSRHTGSRHKGSRSPRTGRRTPDSRRNRTPTRSQCCSSPDQQTHPSASARTSPDPGSGRRPRAHGGIPDARSGRAFACAGPVPAGPCHRTEPCYRAEPCFRTEPHYSTRPTGNARAPRRRSDAAAAPRGERVAATPGPRHGTRADTRAGAGAPGRADAVHAVPPARGALDVHPSRVRAE